MSFRLKAFLAILLLVAAVIISTLLLAENALGDAMESALNARYEERATAARAQRRARDLDLRKRATALAQSVRVFAGFVEYAELDDDEMAVQLLENVRDELLKPGSGPNTDWRFQVYTVRGQLVQSRQLPDTVAMFEGWPTDPETLAQAIESSTSETGILSDHTDALYETVFQPVTDSVSGEAVGALLLARPLEMDLSGTNAVSLRLAGRWFGGFSVAQALPVGRSELLLHNKPHLIFLQRLVTAGGVFPEVQEAVAFSLAAKSRQKRQLAFRLAGAGVVAVFVASFVVAGLAHELSTPIRDLVRATRALGAGDLTTRAPVRRADELGRLAESFNEMVEDLALKEKYRGVLDVVSDPQVAQALLEGGLELGGEERDVSVVFCDIRGFTPTAETMEPREVIAMLNDHFTPLTGVVVDHGGAVLQFAGDLIMALFGAPAACPEHARHAAACALAMVAVRSQMNEKSSQPIEVGIGIATGRVVTGRMGSKDRLNYSVVGSRVNLAARLCAQAKPMQIVTDTPTLAACGPSAIFHALGPLKLKGFSEAFEAFELLGLT